MNSTEGEGRKPSETTDEYWIYARNETNRNSTEPNERCGKWLIFENISRIDDTWEKVKFATETGMLGFASKVSTMKDKEAGRSNRSPSESVICVYTYDSSDQTDVFRVRTELTNLGFTKRLPYKTDQETIAGNYAGGGKRVSKYYK